MPMHRLETLPAFAGADTTVLEAAHAVGQWFSLPGGERLFAAGDPADRVHFLVSGALIAHADGAEDDDRLAPSQPPYLAGYVRPGEPAGEMAMLAGGAHSLSVSALRNCELVAFARADFERLVLLHPPLLLALARLAISRARSGAARAEPRVFALIATSPSVDVAARAHALASQLASIGLRAACVGPEADGREPDWFDGLERDHDLVILYARMGDLDWFSTCLRQADRMWILARRDARPSQPMPLALNPDEPARKFRLVDVIWLWEGAQTGASAAEWMRVTGAQRLLRWRDQADLGRLARMMAARSVGLVLSGGGARAYAHIGVVRAVREAGYQIDLAGGASMGAIIAAAVAMGWDDAEIERRVREAFVDSDPLADFRPPVISFAAGGEVRRRLHTHFGDARYEDLSMPAFAVSSDLAAGVLRVHTTGSVAEALRASIALPGILPPVVDGDAVLVDGAVLDNFPISVMAQMHRGMTIGADVTRERVIFAEDLRETPGFLEWIVRFGPREPPPIASLLMRAATVRRPRPPGGPAPDVLILPELADVELRAWKRFDAVVEAGYLAAQEALAAFKTPARAPHTPAPDV